MTSKPDSVSTLGYHYTDHNGRPLEPQVHWDATGTTLADASTQWCSSGDPVLICIIGTHWKTTGKPLEDHWKTTGSTLAFLQWHSSVHWGLSYRHTGLPLEDHWLRVRGQKTSPGHVIRDNITNKVKQDWRNFTQSTCSLPWFARESILSIIRSLITFAT